MVGIDRDYINQGNRNGETPVWGAIAASRDPKNINNSKIYVDIVKLFLKFEEQFELGLDVNPINPDGDTPLSFVMREGARNGGGFCIWTSLTLIAVVVAVVAVSRSSFSSNESESSHN